MTAAPNIATITASLERSLQNCSLNHERRSSGGGSRGGAEEGIIGRSSTTLDDNNNLPNTVSDTTLELNSHLSLPYHWEQCLDLKTGEIYYINWRDGVKASEDPRTAAADYGGNFYSEEEDDDDDNSLYDSEESSSESSPSCSKAIAHYNNGKNDNNSKNNQLVLGKDKVDNVLVVAGCKSCLMYFMVPKQGEDCPKCNGQLLHFDRSESSSP